MVDTIMLIRYNRYTDKGGNILKIFDMDTDLEKSGFITDQMYNVEKITKQRLLSIDDTTKEATATMKCYQYMFGTLNYIGTYGFSYPTIFNLGNLITDQYNRYVLLFTPSFDYVIMIDFSGDVIVKEPFKLEQGYYHNIKDAYQCFYKNHKKVLDTL